MDEEIEGIDAGIAKTVAHLRSLGYPTCDSGDGTKDYGLPFGHVHVRYARGESVMKAADRIAKDLSAMGLNVARMPEETDIPAFGDVTVAATYCPVDEVGVVSVLHIEDRMWSK